MFYLGSVFLCNKGFEKEIMKVPLSPVKSGCFATLPPCSRNRWTRLTAGVGSAGKETESVYKVSQEELVKRDTPPGASCSAAGGFGVPAPRRWCVRCGGVCFPGVPGFRRCCVCAAPAGGVLGRRKTLESR